jgi:hypothetical protein
MECLTGRLERVFLQPHQASQGDFMGYDLHITRKEFWSDDEGPKIPLAEWESYVWSDPQIASDPENPGIKNYLFIYGEKSCPLWWSTSGEVCTKNPEPEVVAKLVQIAVALGARVLGDDDEIYGLDPLNPLKSVAR